MKPILIILLCSLSIKSEVSSEQLLNHKNNELQKDTELTKEIDDNLNKEEEYKIEELEDYQQVGDTQENNYEYENEV